MQEQEAFALSSAGKHEDATGKLETLIGRPGPTPERLALPGGRYKRLPASATTPGEKPRNFSKAIEHYERGMDLDLNEYFCSSNRPRLYHLRSNRGGEESVESVLKVVITACERAKRRSATDPCPRPTLLAAAFDAGDADMAEELADLVAAEGAARR